MKRHKFQFYDLFIISLSCILCFLCRFPSLIKYGSTISETDSRFNWICAQIIKSKGISSFLEFYDFKSWYPQGRYLGETTYPGLMIFCFLIHRIFTFFHIFIEFSTICIFIGPIFSLLLPIFIYLLCQLFFERRLSSLLSAFFSSINVALVSCSFLGYFDNQSISITLIIIALYLFLRPNINSNFQKSNLIRNVIMLNIVYGFLTITSGEHAYVANVFSLISIFLIFFGDFTINLYLTYSFWFILSSIISSSLPCIGDKIISSMTYALPIFTFIFIQFSFLFQFLRKSLKFSEKSLHSLFLIFLVFIFLIFLFIQIDFRSLPGRIIFIIFPFFSEKNKNFIYSVEEQNPTSWSLFYASLGPFLYLLPVGFYILVKKFDKLSLLLVFITVPTFYFSTMMIRILPIFSIYFIIITSLVIDHFLTQSFRSLFERKKIFDSILSIFLIICFCLLQVYHSIYFDLNPSYSYSLLRPAEIKTSENRTEIVNSADLSESLSWIENNTPENSRIVALWPHGYQIESHTNRTVFCDGNTNNLTHLNLIYLIYASSEHDAWKIARDLDADFIVVVFGGASGYKFDDLYFSPTFIKSLEIEYKDVKIDDFFNSPYLSSENPTSKAKNSLIFKLSYYNFHHWSLKDNMENGFDIARGFKVGSLGFELKFFKEVFTSKNWIFRIYSVSKDIMWND